MLEWLKRFLRDWDVRRGQGRIKKNRLNVAKEYRKLKELQEKKRQLDSLRKDKSPK